MRPSAPAPQIPKALYPEFASLSSGRADNDASGVVLGLLQLALEDASREVSTTPIAAIPSRRKITLMKSIFTVLFSFLLAALANVPASAQIAPAGLAVIQNPAGVYYIFYADSVQQYRSRFYYLNYATRQFDAIDTNISNSGSFSGTSSSTGRTVTGQVSSNAVSLTYNSVTRSGPKESLYGPTSNLAGQWRGVVSDPNLGIGYGEFYVSSHNECLVIYLQDFQYNVGIGTLNANGVGSIPLLSGVTVSGTFSPANGGAIGTFTYSTGGQNTYSVTKAVTSRLANISTRGVVGAGQQVLIAGFVITDGGKTVLVTGEGPTLSARGVTGAVQNPKIDLYRGNQLIASNSSWQTNANAAEIAASGVAPSDPREAALQVDLEPGSYTVIVSSEDTTTGVGLVEVYGVGSAVGF